MVPCWFRKGELRDLHAATDIDHIYPFELQTPKMFVIYFSGSEISPHPIELLRRNEGDGIQHNIRLVYADVNKMNVQVYKVKTKLFP